MELDLSALRRLPGGANKITGSQDERIDSVRIAKSHMQATPSTLLFAIAADQACRLIHDHHLFGLLVHVQTRHGASQYA